MESYLFKARKRHWLLASVTVVLTLFVTAWFLALVDSWIVRLGVVTVLIVAIILFVEHIILPLWRDRLYIDDNEIAGIVDGTPFSFPWKDITAIWRGENTWYEKRLLFIDTWMGAVYMSLIIYDKDAVWEAICKFAHPYQVQDKAYKHSLAYQEWVVASSRLVENLSEPLRAKITAIKVIGWFGVVLTSALLMMSLFSGSYIFLPVNVLFVGLGALVLLIYGDVEIDEEGVTTWIWFGRYFIAWDEIQQVEMDPTGGWLVLSGNNKRLGITGFSTWEGSYKLVMKSIFLYKLEERDIEPKVGGYLTLGIFPKNTRVGRGRKHPT